MRRDTTQSSSPSYDQLQEILGSLMGLEISGGCDHCDAYQTVDQIMPGGWSIATHHDDWCPWWREYRQRKKSA